MNQTQTLSRDAADVTSSAPPARRRYRRWGDLPVGPRRALIILAMLGAWQAAVAIFQVSPLLVSPPTEVGLALLEGFTSGTLAAATATTLKILLGSMLIGMVLAAAFTTLATWTKFGEDLLVLLTAMLNPLPSIAVLPLAILWFGFTTTALVVIIANAVIWPISINVSMGFRTVNPTCLAVGRNIGLSGWRLVRDVLMPAALPHTLSGLKTGWAFGWRTIIAAELVFGVAGGGGGLGYFINDARYFLRIPDVFAGLVTIMAIGIAIELAFSAVERRTVVKWGMKES